jgi:hypothetical protein
MTGRGVVAEGAENAGSGRDDLPFDGGLFGVGAVWQLALADGNSGTARYGAGRTWAGPAPLRRVSGTTCFIKIVDLRP